MWAVEKLDPARAETIRIARGRAEAGAYPGRLGYEVGYSRGLTQGEFDAMARARPRPGREGR